MSLWVVWHQLLYVSSVGTVSMLCVLLPFLDLFVGGDCLAPGKACSERASCGFFDVQNSTTLSRF